MKAMRFTVLIVFLTVVAALSSGRSTAGRQLPATGVQRAPDGPYRDGLFIGKLHRGLGRQEYIICGRWNSDRDRQSFTDGYLVGYSQKD
jgi:hypothetical protein